MRRVMAVLTLFCLSCVNRTENLDYSTNASVELEIPEMVTVYGQNEGKKAENDSEKGDVVQQTYNSNTNIATSHEESETYSDDNRSVSSRNNTNKDQISEAVFYIFDEKGLFVSKNAFIGPENYKLEFKKNGRHSVYVLCNISEFVDLPEAPSQDELESLMIPHRERYDRLPFAGKTEVNVTQGEKPAIKIKLDRINSAIRIENRSADKIALNKVTVNGLPSYGNVFLTDTEAADVTYGESAEAETDADGNAVVYSFFVPDSKISNVRIEAEATIKETNESATTVAPVTFIDRLETGKQATALVGYLESGNLKIGSPDNWGNVGRYELPGGVQLQVIGGEFFDYKSAKALRAYSGGSEFSCIVKSADGVATLQTVGTAEWVEIRDNIIIVAANPAATERECQVSVSVGGKNVGVFYIVQGKAITFSCPSLAITDNKLEMVGGTGSSSAVHTVSFDIDDAELEGLEIVSGDNGTSGVTVDIDREAKRLLCHFMALVDASLVDASGVSVHVDFVDINGTVQSTVTISQRPAKITFSPSIHKNISYEGGTVLAAVTVETDAKWNVRSITDQSGATVSWLPKPAGSFNSGGNLHLTADPNDTNSGRTAYVRVQSRYTVSKPYEITQMPSYGISNISANGVWDAASNTLKAYSKEQEYAITFETDTALPEDMEIKAVCDLEGANSSAVTHTSGNNYTFALTLPDSDNSDEEVTGRVNIMAGEVTIGSFKVIQAKKPIISVSQSAVIGGSEAVSGSFVASAWDLAKTDFVTSSNTDMAIGNLSESGTFTVAMAAEMDQSFAKKSATITLVGATGDLATCEITQEKVLFNFDPASLSVDYVAGNESVTVSSSNANTADFPGMTATSSDDWCTVSVSKASVIVTVKANGSITPRSTSVYVTYKGCKSDAFTVTQTAGVPETVTIGGVTWSSLNVDDPGMLAKSIPSSLTGIRADSHGKFYQWDSKVTWSTSGSITEWNTATSPNSYWTDTNNPCPSGFVVPTNAQWEALISTCNSTNMGGTWSDTNYGYITLTDKTDSAKKLEFIATGRRSYTDGTLENAGTLGHYWSYEQSSLNFAYSVYFNNTSGLLTNTANKTVGRNVRCVRKTEVPTTVTIGGLEWMRYNVDTPGTTVKTLPSEVTGTRLVSHGKLYQWNRKVAWNTTGSVSNWDATVPSGSYWEAANNPCPSGFVVPTNTQWETLINSCNTTNGGEWSSSDYGYKVFTDKTNSDNKLELPAVGSRSLVGSLGEVAAIGRYWSSVNCNTSTAYRIYFDNSSVNVSNSNKQYGFSVRCVRQK